MYYYYFSVFLCKKNKLVNYFYHFNNLRLRWLVRVGVIFFNTCSASIERACFLIVAKTSLRWSFALAKCLSVLFFILVYSFYS